MSDEIVDLSRERTRRQPPVPLTLGAFALLVLAAVTVIAALLGGARLLDRAL